VFPLGNEPWGSAQKTKSKGKNTWNNPSEGTQEHGVHKNVLFWIVIPVATQIFFVCRWFFYM
jgi:hypothetical protein